MGFARRTLVEDAAKRRPLPSCSPLILKWRLPRCVVDQEDRTPVLLRRSCHLSHVDGLCGTLGFGQVSTHHIAGLESRRRCAEGRAAGR